MTDLTRREALKVALKAGAYVAPAVIAAAIAAPVAAASPPPGTADLALSAMPLGLSPVLGATITLTITLRNAGPATATNVQIALDASLQAILNDPPLTVSQGTLDLTGSIWLVGSLASGAFATLMGSGTVLNVSPRVGIASILHSDQPDPFVGDNTVMIPYAPHFPSR